MMKRNRGLWMLCAAALGTLGWVQVTSASTAVSTEQSGSIIVFPKVVWDGTRDTIITISNTTNPMRHAHCFYINGATPGQCQETDFDIWLTKQQPTHWVASEGRRQVSIEVTGENAGFSPGAIPPVPPGFIGELKCVQVLDDGTLDRSNALKGEATLRRIDGDVSKYNALTFQGNAATPDCADPRQQQTPECNPNDLVLDLTPNTVQDTGNGPGLYSACPDTLVFNYYVHGVNDPVVESIGDCQSEEGGCPIETTLTLIPCSENLETGRPTKVTANFDVFDEFERRLSGAISVNCYLNAPLSQISPALTAAQIIGSDTAYARITAAPGNGGLIGIAEETRFSDNEDTFPPCTANDPADCLLPRSATAAMNLHTEGNRFDAATDGNGNPVPGVTDHIIIPGE